MSKEQEEIEEIIQRYKSCNKNCVMLDTDDISKLIKHIEQLELENTFMLKALELVSKLLED